MVKINSLKVYVFSLLLIITNYTYSQEKNKATTILNEFSAKIQSYSSITAQFSFSLENKEEDMTDSFDGDITLKGEKYKLSIMGVETFFDGKTMWSYLQDFEEVSISEPDEEDNSMFNPAEIFSIYKEGFTNIYNGEKNEQYHLSLVPDDASAEYSKIDVIISKKQHQLLSVRYYGNDGNDYIVKIKSFKTNIAYEDSVFKFITTNFPGVEVIDLR